MSENAELRMRVGQLEAAVLDLAKRVRTLQQGFDALSAQVTQSGRDRVEATGVLRDRPV